MRIRKETPQRLEAREVPWGTWVFGAAFAAVGVVIFVVTWEATTLTCLRPPAPEPGCALLTEGLRGSDSTHIRLNELDSAVVAMGTDSEGREIYRVELSTGRGWIPLTTTWTNDLSTSEAARQEINAFVGDPQQASLEVTVSLRGIALLFGLIFVGAGMFVGLGFGRIVSVELSVPEDRVRLSSRGLFGVKTREHPLHDIVDALVQVSKGGKSTNYRVAFVLRNGAEVPLVHPYRSGFNGQQRIAETIRAFVRSAQAKRGETEVAPPVARAGADRTSPDSQQKPPFGLRIRDDEPGRLEIRSIPVVVWLGGGFFMAIGVLVFSALWETTTFECARTPAPDSGCILETRRLLSSGETSIPIEELDSARVMERVGRDSDGNRQVTYRLELLTVEGRVIPFVEGWSSGRFGRDMARNRINEFLRDHGQTRVSAAEGSRGRAIFVGAAMFGPGLLLLLAVGGITTVVCSVPENRVYTTRRSLLGTKKRDEHPLDRLEGAVVQEFFDGDGKKSGTYRVALVLRDGSEVPLTRAYSSGLAEKTLIAGKISKFAEAAPGQAGPRPSLWG